MKKETPVLLSFYSVLFLAISLLNLSLFNYAYDDAYIHFRIAENFLVHGRPYFNLDERLMATSSPGWTLTLFAIFLMTGVKLKAVSIFNAAATTLAVYIYARVVDKAVADSKISHDVLVALVLLPILAYSSIGLMETSFALLLLGLGVLLYLRKDGLAFLFFGLCVFFRFELVVFLLLFLAFNAYKKAVPVWKTGFFASLGAAPFLAFDYAFFGTSIPHTIRAKSAVFSLNRVDVIDVGVPRFFFEGSMGVMIEFILLVVLLYVALRTALKYRGDFEHGVILLFLAGGASVFLAYFIQKTYIFSWYPPLYYAPVFISALVFAMKKRAPALIIFLLLAFLPFAALFCVTLYASLFDKSAYQYFSHEARVQKYLDVGRRLYERYPDYTLMTSEIGGLGFAFKGKIYDGAGLVSEDVLKYHPMKVPEQRPSGKFGSIPAGYAREIRPDIIVSYDFNMDRLFTPDILDKYVRIEENIYMPEDMAIMRKKSLLPENRLIVLIKKDRFTKGY